MCLEPTSGFTETERCSSGRVWSKPEFFLVDKAGQYLPSLRTCRLIKTSVRALTFFFCVQTL